jgi:hypothetical protein
MAQVLSPLTIAIPLGLLGLLLLGWFFPKLADRWCRTVEDLGSRLAKRKSFVIVALMLLVALIRVALLPLMRVPAPAVHDEFSYLLAADTFAHARLTNPPHPMWRFFETIHVNQLPTYMSKYPPAQGAVLAVGQLLGHPWIGVLLSMALMCGSLLWMLQGWLPPRWALLGAVLVFLRFGLFSYWMNSYWGGAIATIGGAMVLGALPRILRWQRHRDAMLLGLGVAILANSRLLEGFLFCLPVAAYLALWMFGKRISWRAKLMRVCAPLLLILVPTAAFIGYYNWRVTGNPLLLPYVVNDRTYSPPPPFFWENLGAPIHQQNPQMEGFYNGWARSYWVKSRFAFHVRVAKFAYFFLWPELCVPLVALPWLWKDRRIRFLLLQFAFCFVGLLAVVWFEPHYAAPLLATLIVILVQGIRHLRQWRTARGAYGVAATRALVAFAMAMNLVYAVEAARNPQARSLVAPAGAWGVAGNLARARTKAELSARLGLQLAIVRYLPDSNGEWVYNGADIDHSKVVWARETPGMDIRPLLEYFRWRSVWLVEPTNDSARIRPYPIVPPRPLESTPKD